MKPSKISLGVTTCLLSFAAISAAMRFGPPVQRWYCTFAGVKCVQTPPITCISNPNAINPIKCTVTITMGGITRHLPIYTQGWVGPCSNCLNQLLYTRAD